MPPRSITDEEIALIKAMLKRGMKNKDIQFFFNRPDRPVNSGRITGIREGSYGPSKSIAVASEAELDRFLAKHSSSDRVGAVLVPGAAGDSDPLNTALIARWFSKDKGGEWRFTGGESDRHECKASFGFKHQDKWLRPIAALANNAGGYVLFGVHDKDAQGPNGEDWSHFVVGLETNDFEIADPADFATRIKAVFDPTPQFQLLTTKIGSKKLGVVYVYQHPSRPVIATKNEGSVKEGDIFFRYPGQSARIKYSDLRAMLDARDAETRRQLVPMMGRLLRLGPDRAMIADLEAGTLTDSRTTIRLDRGIVNTLTGIKEGQFSEETSAKGLKLVGEVEPTIIEKTRIEYSVLNRKQIFAAFLNQVIPADPKLYIRWAVECGEGAWLPMHYFARIAGLTRAELVDFIKATEATPARKRASIDHVRPDAAYKRPTGNLEPIVRDVLAGNLPPVTNSTEASRIGQALQGLPADARFDLRAVLDLLKQCLDLTARMASASFVRRGLCRVDEIAFGERLPAMHVDVAEQGNNPS